MGKHRIQRAEIELGVADAALAEALSTRISALRDVRIAPVLERVCEELSPYAPLERIETLELDLGALAHERFDEEFVQRLEPALRAALRAALGPGTSAAREERAALELVEVFARTGNLMWWARSDEPDVIERQLDALATTAPQRLLELLHRLRLDAAAIARVARYASRALPLLLAAAWPETARDVSAALERAARAAGPTPAHAALRLREAMLTALLEPTPSSAEEALRAIAAQRVERSPNLSELVALAARSAPPPMAAEGASSMHAATSLHAAISEQVDSPAARATSSDANALLEPALPLARSGAAELRATAPGEIALPAVREHNRPLRSVARAVEPRPAVVALESQRRAALQRLEELHVEDAGLVILWPFLERFFTRLNLLDPERRFHDDRAAMRAVVLLEFLASGESEAPEFRLPLAKLLAGRAIDSELVCDPLEPEELGECDRLLAAVIERAPVLGDLSIAGLQSVFLQRPGVLAIEPGAWVLRVERRAHDALLERFPWSWSWLRLAWMPDPLRVEW